jgi:hypothetical protein
MAAAGLEARYRRLLRWFPADHRVVHREEMLDVLMAAADNGRDKPGVAETADLLLGAARIRVRPGRALSDRAGWRDALATFSLAAPVLVLASVCLAYLTTNLLSIHAEFGIPDAFMTPSTILGSYYGQASAIMWLVIAGQSCVVLLVLLGLRRCAAAATVLYLAVIIGVQEVQQPYTGLAILRGLFLLVLPAAEIVALLASPGPRRGRELLRRRHWALLAVGAVAAAAITGNYAFLSGTGGRLPNGGSWWSGNVTVLTSIHVSGAAVAVIVLLAVWLSSATGKRLAVLFAVLAYPAVEQVLLQYVVPPFWALDMPYWLYAGISAALEVLIVCAPAVVIYRARHRAWSLGSSSGEGLAGP